MKKRRFKIVENDCWEWTAAKNKEGYGQICLDKKQFNVHRLMYRIAYGNFPAYMQVDHLCRNPSCVNPDHMEAVVPKENTLRGTGPSAVNSRRTHCKRGHPLVEDNLKIVTSSKGRAPYRACLACARIRQRNWYRRKKDVC